MTAERLREKAQKTLKKKGLAGFVDWDGSQSLDLPGNAYMELSIRDATKQEEIAREVGSLQGKVEVEYHPVWQIANVGEPDIARSSSGAIVPAQIVPVELRSGSVSTTVHVLITHLAELELRRLAGKDFGLGRLARVYLESLMQWGGRSYWDPRKRNWLEIGSDRALALYGAFKKSA